MEPFGPNEVVDLVIVVPLTSFVPHLNAVWLGVSGSVDGELIVTTGVEVHVFPLNQVSDMDLSPWYLSDCPPMNCR